MAYGCPKFGTSWCCHVATTSVFYRKVGLLPKKKVLVYSMIIEINPYMHINSLNRRQERENKWNGHRREKREETRRKKLELFNDSALWSACSLSWSDRVVGLERVNHLKETMAGRVRCQMSSSTSEMRPKDMASIRSSTRSAPCALALSMEDSIPSRVSHSSGAHTITPFPSILKVTFQGSVRNVLHWHGARGQVRYSL